VFCRLSPRPINNRRQEAIKPCIKHFVAKPFYATISSNPRWFHRKAKYFAQGVDKTNMSFIGELLAGKQIQDALVDSELTYIMLTDGTQITIRGLVVVEPSKAPSQFAVSIAAS
jgi:hypothetical protein